MKGTATARTPASPESWLGSVSVKLRPYQQQAVSRAIAHFKTSSAPACVVLPTGAGKSLVIAELARIAQRRVLVVAHVKELCRQNYEKFVALDVSHAGMTGLYSAGLGHKNASRKVTFASIQSAAQNLDAFASGTSLLIIDECHRVGDDEHSQYSRLISRLRQENAELKVLGLTATPYRLGMGYCYQLLETPGRRPTLRTEDARPFSKCVYEVSLRKMVDQGYLTSPRIEDTPIAQYDFSSLEVNRFGEYVEGEVNVLLSRHKRVTRAIVEQVVEIAERQGRRGVMIFAATVEHAREIDGYLPRGQAALILGETDSMERDRLIAQFSAQKLRFLVNVAVLTTGFDAPHVDFIAILRTTQSVSLYQQIVGRGLRLSPDKQDCLVMDYAGNGYDVFSPEVGERRPERNSVPVAVVCPQCSFENTFWGIQDEDGHVVEHFGRRCHGAELEGAKVGVAEHRGARERFRTWVRCSYRFRFKECDQCGAENDIAARRCQHCGKTLVDVDEQLKNALRLSDALVLRVSGMQLSVEGKKLKITYHDEDGASVSERFDFSAARPRERFNRIFGRRIASGRRPLELTEPAQALALGGLIPTPGFVVARKQKLKGGRGTWFRVEARIFDYQGRYRLAHEA